MSAWQARVKPRMAQMLLRIAAAAAYLLCLGTAVLQSRRAQLQVLDLSLAVRQPLTQLARLC